ncbi:hypothetical protein U9M48_018507 [Paspalum notatum var. saurae]|uniref:ABC transporter domain-containing protein n=1 Tax=Paspalum notatum var. saurae TaxID=547442 RepID=A0AAQ3TD20_PASNO
MEDDEGAPPPPTRHGSRRGGVEEKTPAAAGSAAAEEERWQQPGPEERRRLLERLVSMPEDNGAFLAKIKQRMDSAHVENPTIEVRFKNLSIDAEAYIGKRGVPTIANFFTNKMEEVLNFLHIIPTKKAKISILQDISGIIKPSRLTLLLGPPGCGKTSLLLALAGQLDSALKMSGVVTYNGHTMDEFVPQRCAAYVSQEDVHLAEMTVRETFSFSARCQGTGARQGLLSEVCAREKVANIKPDPNINLFMKARINTMRWKTLNTMQYHCFIVYIYKKSNLASSFKGHADIVTDYILKNLGVEMCADTLVGDAMTRGISGGQKKRVTTGEMLVGPTKVLFMDEISTGLDSSTTFQTVRFLQQLVHILEGTALISLLQPTPETYKLFDDIILLSDGKIVYQGPRVHVQEFFEWMGFKCPTRKGVADFLQEVTSKRDQQQYWVKDAPHQYVSAVEFSEAFRSFHVSTRLQADLQAPFNKKRSHPIVLTSEKYGASKMELFQACFSREYLLMKRNSFVYIFKLMQLIFQAFIVMTVFMRTEMQHNNIEDGTIYIGILYSGVNTSIFNAYQELVWTVVRLPVFHKQRNIHMYPAWAYALPMFLLRIPVSILESIIWTAMTYYTVGFDPSFERMLKQILLFTLVSQMAYGKFRLLAALGRDMVTTYTIQSFADSMLLALGGFYMSRNNIKEWFIWGYWSSPLMYAMNAITANEFLGKQWNNVISNGQTTDTIGIAVMKSHGFFPEPYWFWIGAGALVGYAIVLNSLFALALAYFDQDGKPTTAEICQAGILNKTDGIVLPFTPLTVVFEDIKYSIDMPKQMKGKGDKEDRLTLLNGLTGAFQPGVLTALMGVSGAGKTTLLDVLAGRKTGGYIEGSIKVSGFPKKQETFARVSGYCEQNDIHSPHVTVCESLIHSAWLRLPSEVSYATKMAFVKEVMELVELTALKDAIIGLPGISGLSIDQRKRLTIAVELVANPSVIFMDEPTSGLDARAAAVVMRTVRNTVNTGRTVVCTIHQPSIDVFESFDELFLIKLGGEEIYVGPLGDSSHHLVEYFQKITGENIKEGYNPATWMLEITSDGQEELIGVNFAEMYKNSEMYRHNRQDMFDAMGSMCSAVFFIGVQNTITIQPVVDAERTVFYREKAAGMYSSYPYALAQVMIEIPYVFIQSVMFTLVLYPMVGYAWALTKFLWFLYFIFTTFLYFTYYGMVSVSVSPNCEISLVISAAFYNIWSIFSGFVIPYGRIPIWWRWYYWLNPVAWSLYGLVTSQYGDLEGTLGDATGKSIKDYILWYFGFNKDFLKVVAAVVLGFNLLFAFIFIVSIKVVNYQSR